MANSIARDAEDFARLLFQTIGRLGAGGDWVPARLAFDRTVAEQPDHPYAAHLKAKPARRIGLTAVTERLRESEFPRIERRKAGTRRNAPVFYRVGQASAALNLQLPADVPAEHPLVKKHRFLSAAGGQLASARRALLSAPLPRSPWRRRFLPRRVEVEVPRGLEAASRSLRHWWERLRSAVAELTAGTRRG